MGRIKRYLVAYVDDKACMIFDISLSLSTHFIPASVYKISSCLVARVTWKPTLTSQDQYM